MLFKFLSTLWDSVILCQCCTVYAFSSADKTDLCVQFMIDLTFYRSPSWAMKTESWILAPSSRSLMEGQRALKEMLVSFCREWLHVLTALWSCIRHRYCSLSYRYWFSGFTLKICIYFSVFSVLCDRIVCQPINFLQSYIWCCVECVWVWKSSCGEQVVPNIPICSNSCLFVEAEKNYFNLEKTVTYIQRI